MAQVLNPPRMQQDVQPKLDVKEAEQVESEEPNNSKGMDVDGDDNDSTDYNSSNNDDKRRTMGRWYLGETLGKGGYSWVKKGYDRKTGSVVALKFMDRKRANGKGWNEKQIKQVKTEIDALRQIKHVNIMRLLAYNLNAKYPDQDGSYRHVILLVLEHMSGGELFDILYYTQALEEAIARTYFRQLIDGLECCHNACIIHRDIKPQNLLLDKNFVLKITDFGLAKLVESDSDAIMETYHVGTRGYQAPEILARKPYTAACDIFASGVVLFILLTGYPPFEHAREEDRWYGHIVKKQYKKFWKSHRGCGIQPIAMDLITKMILYDPDERASISDIKKHPWYGSDILPQKELAKVLRLRHAQMEIKRANDPLKASILIESCQKRPIIVQDNVDMKTPAPLLPQDESVGLLDVFSENSCYEIFQQIVNIVENSKGQCVEDLSNFTMQAEMAVQYADKLNGEAIEETVVILIRVFYYEPYACNIIKFHRLEGSMNAYKHTLNYIIRQAKDVLTGVPQKYRNQFDLTDDDKDLLSKYFKDSSSPDDSPCVHDDNDGNQSQED